MHKILMAKRHTSRQWQALTLVIGLAAHLGHLPSLAEEVCHLGVARLKAHITYKDGLVVLPGHHSDGVPIAAGALRPLQPSSMQHLPQFTSTAVEGGVWGGGGGGQGIVLSLERGGRCGTPG